MFCNIFYDMHISSLISSQIRRFSIMAQSRVYAISDLHVDIRENEKFVKSWSDVQYKDDIVIVAGDLTDRLYLLEEVLIGLKQKFKEVFYVPGNHELWIRNEPSKDSVSKFHLILDICSKIGVKTQPAKINLANTSENDNYVWIVPLFSWYSKPEDNMEDSLYVAPTGPRREDPKFSEQVWMDNHLCNWSLLPHGTNPAQYFSSMNQRFIDTETIDDPVISFSHFVPRLDLVAQTEDDLKFVNEFRFKNHLGEAPKFQGGTKGFNFTRYAGSKILESQIRQLKSSVHVYGHQHRNRDRVIDGIRYVSHCLGNRNEQKEGWTWGIDKWNGPKMVWPQLVNKIT